MQIPESLKDHRLRIPASLYSTICVPFRLLLGLFLIVYKTRWTSFLLLVIAIFAAIGLGYKRIINPNSWKHYYRPISIYIIISILAMIDIIHENNNLQDIAGVLIIVDAIIGKQGQYEVQILSNR